MSYFTNIITGLLFGGQVSELQGCELAEFLVKRGRKVTIVDTANEMGKGMTEDDKRQLLRWLEEKGATMVTGVKYEQITDKGIAIITKAGKRQIIEADSIILAMPMQPNIGLIKSLGEKVPAMYPIGDCREPRLLANAIAYGARIAYTI